MPVSTYFKYMVMLFTEGLIVGVAILIVPFAFNLFGVIIAGIAMFIFIALFFVVLWKFLTVGLSEYTFEETVISEGKKLTRQVIIRDSKYNIEWFNRKGFLIPTQRGQYFLYGYPFLFGHKKLIINALTNEQMKSTTIMINSAAPAIYPGELYLETENAIKVKGAVDNWVEFQQYASALEISKKTGVFMREAVASNPQLLKEKLHEVTLEDLTSKAY